MRRKQSKPLRRTPGTLFVVARMHGSGGVRMVVEFGPDGERVWRGDYLAELSHWRNFEDDFSDCSE